MTHKSNTNNPIDFPKPTGWRKRQIDNLIAGAEQNSGDGGYSIGTEAGYENMCKQRSVALVIALVGIDLTDDWWNSPNKAFDMKTPADMWVEDFRQVHNYLMHHAYAGGGS